ncbi:MULTISPECIES: hypothetical protein [unclassified Nocardia]|uniref:hypothetical protein n=1 Tax=unclassified Nocardia TaxID=2637762 RepID=UPI0024A91243|nr:MULTISPECIES: hypothetical protein [unclassified Nocardia]
MNGSGFDSQDASEIVFSVGELILLGVTEKDEEWCGLAVAVTMHRQKSMFGYAYFEDGSWSADLELSIEILDRVAELKSVMSSQDGKDWKVCLFQIERSEMKMNVEFEYKDADRWRITPRNFNRMIERLRPQ